MKKTPLIEVDASPKAKTTACAAAAAAELEGVPMGHAAGKVTPAEATQLMTDKYAPQTTKKILGQQGDRSPMNKLKQWLENWHRNRHRKDKIPLKCML